MNDPVYEQMWQLIQKLRQADIAYYKHDAPVMSDLEYDRLMDELVALEEESGVILSGSPTQRVAGEIYWQRFGTQSPCFLPQRQNLWKT